MERAQDVFCEILSGGVSDEHRAWLHARHVSDDTISDAGLTSLTKEAVVRVLRAQGGSDDSVDVGEGVAIPLFGRDNQVIGTRVLLALDDGSLPGRAGWKEHPYVPPQVARALRAAPGSGSSVYVVRHDEEALGLVSMGFLAIAASPEHVGIHHGGFDLRGDRRLHPDLDGLGGNGLPEARRFDRGFLFA